MGLIERFEALARGEAAGAAAKARFMAHLGEIADARARLGLSWGQIRAALIEEAVIDEGVSEERLRRWWSDATREGLAPKARRARPIAGAVAAARG